MSNKVRLSLIKTQSVGAKVSVKQYRACTVMGGGGWGSGPPDDKQVSPHLWLQMSLALNKKKKK